MKTKNRNRTSDAQHVRPNVIITQVCEDSVTQTVEPAPQSATPRRADPAHELFMRAFNSTVARLQCKPEWANGTGYFNHAVYDEELKTQIPLGDRGTFVDGYGRKALVLHTRLGIAVVFERYSEGSTALVCNADDGFSKLQREEVIDISSIVRAETLMSLLLITQLSATA